MMCEVVHDHCQILHAVQEMMGHALNVDWKPIWKFSYIILFIRTTFRNEMRKSDNNYLERTRRTFGEHTEHESSEQLLTELFDGVRAPFKKKFTQI